MNVSVIIPVYNAEKFVRKAVESALQLSEVKEVILIEDCSPDKTQEIVQGYIDTHPKGHWTHYTRHSANKGMMPNFIWALNQAKGKYIALCEGDDYWTDPLKLQKQVDFLEENEEYVVSGHNAYIINDKAEKIKESKLPEMYKKDVKGKELKKMFWILTLTMVFRNIPKVLADFQHVTKSPNGDSCLTSILGNYGRFHYLKEIKPAAYRVHAGGGWSMLENEKKNKNLLNTFNVLLNFYYLKQDLEMINYYREKIDHNIIQEFDYGMNNCLLKIKLSNIGRPFSQIKIGKTKTDLFISAKPILKV